MIKEYISHYDNGQVYMHYSYDSVGLIHGDYKVYYKHGQLRDRCFYIHGKVDGEYISYYKDGRIDLQCHYKNGKLHGVYRDRHKNGQLDLHCHYKDNMHHGEYKLYSPEGDLQEHSYYYMDNAIGPEDIANYPHPTPEELVMIELKYGDIEC